jgi:hypothetical protein
MPLTQEEIDEFNERGFLPREELLTPLEVKALHLRLEDIGNEVVEFPPQYVQIEPLVNSGELEKDSVRFNNVRKIWNLTKYDALFREYARHPAILDVVHSLLGPNLKIYVDQTLCKPPRVGSAKPPHQDSAYWTSIDPPNLVICWMALDDATEENGCMRFIPGSHKLGGDRAQAPRGLPRRGRKGRLRARGCRAAQGWGVFVPPQFGDAPHGPEYQPGSTHRTDGGLYGCRFEIHRGGTTAPIRVGGGAEFCGVRLETLSADVVGDSS